MKQIKQKELSFNQMNPKCHCDVCQLTMNGKHDQLKTTTICVTILKVLTKMKPEQEFFSLKTDIHPFIQSHWNKLIQMKQFQQKNWKKAILDAFNHCTMIESGKEQFEKRGLYKLKKSFFKKEMQQNAQLNAMEKKEEMHSTGSLPFEMSLTLMTELNMMTNVLMEQLMENCQLLSLLPSSCLFFNHNGHYLSPNDIINSSLSHLYQLSSCHSSSLSSNLSSNLSQSF